MADLLIIPPLILGTIIGLYELILIHRDENFRGSHWLGHGLHAALFAIGATFVTMNAAFVYDQLGFLQGIPFIKNVIVFQIAIGLIAMLKVHASSAVVKSTVGSTKGMKETWAHSFIVAGLVVAAPYIWPLIEPLFSKIL
jgi:hypothetical protein